MACAVAVSATLCSITTSSLNVSFSSGVLTFNGATLATTLAARYAGDLEDTAPEGAGCDAVIVADGCLLTGTVSVPPALSEQVTVSVANLNPSTAWVVVNGAASAATRVLLRRTFTSQLPSLYAHHATADVSRQPLAPVQMMAYAAPGGFYSEPSALLQRFYALSSTMGSVDVSHLWGSPAVLSSCAPGCAAASGVAIAIAGTPAPPVPAVWDSPDPWAKAAPVAVAAGQAWRESYTVAVAAAAYPAGPGGVWMAAGGAAGSDEVAAMMVGAYASIAGNFEGLAPARRGLISTTIHHPDTGYSGLYNFFDPDNFIGLSAALAVASPELAAAAAAALDRTGGDINPRTGELPHHFVWNGTAAIPTYAAISGATQLGPNTFWIATCLAYTAATADYEWLRARMPTVRLAASFVDSFYDDAVGMLKAPGALFIDVFIRGNYSADSNGGYAWLLRRLGDAEDVFGNATGAAELRARAARVEAAMGARLWAGDHFVTQVDPDGGVRDFVDYDANAIAASSPVTTLAMARAALARMDRGNCTHGRATWVSERYYGPKDCVGGNTGDSACAMGRIGWFDALARRRVGDAATFKAKILAPLVADVLRYTWLYERYRCDGSRDTGRTPFYFEYPAVTTMMVRDIYFGLSLGVRDVSVAPFGAPVPFDVGVGGGAMAWRLAYNAPHNVTLLVPSSAAVSRHYSFAGMAANATYTAQVDSHIVARAVADASGLVAFEIALPMGSTLLVSRVA